MSGRKGEGRATAHRETSGRRHNRHRIRKNDEIEMTPGGARTEAATEKPVFIDRSCTMSSKVLRFLIVLFSMISFIIPFMWNTKISKLSASFRTWHNNHDSDTYSEGPGALIAILGGIIATLIQVGYLSLLGGVPNDLYRFLASICYIVAQILAHLFGFVTFKFLFIKYNLAVDALPDWSETTSIYTYLLGVLLTVGTLVGLIGIVCGLFIVGAVFFTIGMGFWGLFQWIVKGERCCDPQSDRN